MIRALALLSLLTTAPAAIVERWAVVTAYSPSIEGGGTGTGRTSIGVRTDAVPYGIAADPRLVPYGALVWVPGYRETEEKGGPWWEVDDTGADMRRAGDVGVLHLDLRMRHVWSARQWGRRWALVRIYVPEDM